VNVIEVSDQDVTLCACPAISTLPCAAPKPEPDSVTARPESNVAGVIVLIDGMDHQVNVKTPDALIWIVSVLPVVVVTSAGVLSKRQKHTTRSGVGVSSIIAEKRATIEPPEAVQEGSDTSKVAVPVERVQVGVTAAPPAV
jgi:hypothetical protein